MAILVVEDEQQLAANIKRGLEVERYSVDLAYDGETAFVKALENKYDAIILDLMLPKKDGLLVCTELRREGVHTPIVILSAKISLEDRVKGLDAGADDYITKPFEFDELLARIRSVLRRRKVATPVKLSVGDVELDPATHEVYREGKSLDLTPKEYSILEYLMRHYERAVSRQELLMHVWGADNAKTSNPLNVHVRYLRRKLDDPYKKHYIKTIQGFGYRMSE